MRYKIIRTIFQLAALIIFLFQAQESLQKYFSYPIVNQKSEINLDEIEAPTFFICKNDLYNYEKGNKMGYDYKSKFLAGMLSVTESPSWTGKKGDIAYNDLLYELFDDSFSTNISSGSKLEFLFPEGFCFSTNTKDDLLITTKKDNLIVYIVHESKYKKISIDPQTVIHLGPTSNTTFEYKNYRIDYTAIDNTVFEGQECVDYRKMTSTYGDCIYQAFIEQLHSIYGCYPPWVKTEDQKCDLTVESKKLDKKTFQRVWEDIDSLTDGLDIEIQKNCVVPCYDIKLDLKKMVMSSSFKNNAILKIVNSKAVPVTKAVYSFDKFMLTVELGSALGLWLGMFI